MFIYVCVQTHLKFKVLYRLIIDYLMFCFLLLTIVYNLNTTKIDRKWGKNIDFYAVQVN